MLNGTTTQNASRTRLFPGTSVAFVRAALPDSYATECLTDVDNSRDPINLAKAKEQHRRYVNNLVDLVPHVVHLRALEEDKPDAVFVEDTVVVVGDTAVLTRPGTVSRRGEVDSMEEALHTLLASKSTAKRGNEEVEEGTDDAKPARHVRSVLRNVVRVPGPDATLEGGDVLFTGRHVFVGLSHRTNDAGAQFLADAVAHTGVPVVKVPLHATPATRSILHLKCLISLLCPNTILVADTEAGRAVRFYIERETLAADDRERHDAYEFVVVPDVVPSNVLCIPSAEDPSRIRAVFVQDGFPQSQRIIRDALRQRGHHEETGTKIIELNMSEIIKGDGALTCMSVLM